MRLPSFVFLFGFSLASPLAAQITSNWTGAVDQQWDTQFNWDIGFVPNNSGPTTYDAFVGGGAGLVFLNANNTLESFTMQLGASLSISDGFSFTIRDDSVNDGSIILGGNTNVSRVAISDSSGDFRVQLGGTGEILLDHPSDRIGGTLNHVLVQTGDHTVRGHGNFGENAIRIENSGFVIADSPGNTLFVDPFGPFDNMGFLWAHGGGEMELLSGTYTNSGLGEFSIDDNSEIRLNGVTVAGGTVKALQQNGIAEDNRLVVSGNSTLTDVTVETATFVNDGRVLTLNGTAFTNHGPLRLESASSTSRLSFSGSVGNAITLGGNGSILLDQPLDQVTGTLNHTLTHEAPHEISGGGSLGADSLNFVNRSTVTATSGAIPLVVDPRSTWVNENGTLRADPGAVARLNSGIYSCTGTGRFAVGDGATIELNGVTVENSPFDIEDGDSDPLNHLLRVTASSTLDACESDAVIRVDDGRVLTLREDFFRNDGEVHLDGAVGASRLFVQGGGDLRMELGGTGTLFLDHVNDQVTGTINHLLVNAASHRIEGHGLLGLNSLNILNHGAIESTVPAEVLVIDPVGSLTNDGGTLTAGAGASCRFEPATYGTSNGGRFVVGDGATFDLRGGTWSDLVLEIDDQDADPANHMVGVNASTTFTGVTAEAVVSVANSVVLTVNGSLTNGQRIDLDASSGTSQIFFADSSDFEVELAGPGLLRLDSGSDQVTGALNHTLVQRAPHRITGGGFIGLNSLNLRNEGTIAADLPGTPLVVDPRSTFTNDGGSLAAGASTLVRLLPGTYEAVNGGSFTVGEDAELRMEGTTMRDLTLAGLDSDGDPLDHHGTVAANTSFLRVINELALTVDDGRNLTLQGGDFTNLGTIFLDATTASTSLFIEGGGNGNTVPVLGDGEVTLASDLSRITGALNHLLIHGADHVISGFGQVGTNSIDIRNHGTIRSAVPGETLLLDPRSSFVNDGGVLAAEDLAVVRFQPGTYSSLNGGSYTVGEDARFALTGPTLEDLALAAANTAGTAANHFATVEANTTFRRVTNELALNIENGRTLTLEGGTSTNNGEITLDPGGNLTTIYINGSATGNTITIDGTGSIRLDGPLDQVTGTINHLFVNGTGHRIEGSGEVGRNSLFLRNEGVYHADRAGEALVLDQRGGSIDNRGTLRAGNGGILDIRDPVSDTGGTILAGAGSTVQANGAISQSSGTTTVDGTLAATSLTLDKSLLQGGGLVDNPVTATFSTVRPGNSTGTLTVDGATTLGTGTSLAIEVNATADHDVLAVTGGPLQVTGSTLRLDYLGGPADVSGTDTLTIITAAGGVVGEFLNVTDGARLYSANGVASFVVNYLPNAVTLTDFIWDPSGPPNQPPVFTASVGNLAVDENTAPGTLLATFAAYDPEGVAIEFTLSDPGAPFTIDLLNGELRVSGPLDHEEQASYSLAVIASDTVETSQVPLTITINDLPGTNAELVENLLTGPGGAFEGETDPAVISYDADPDGDGRANIFELWRATDPATPDAPSPAEAAAYFILGEERGSVTVAVDAAIDDQLLIGAEFSFDLLAWRDATLNREVLSEDGGLRTLRFYDTVPIPPDGRFFARFTAAENAEP